MKGDFREAKATASELTASAGNNAISKAPASIRSTMDQKMSSEETRAGRRTNPTRSRKDGVLMTAAAFY